MAPQSFWSRVRKGRLVQVLAVYLGAAWVILQVSYILQDSAGLPAWVSPFAILLLLIGLVVVLATAWVQSHPLATARAEADETPGSWELGLREMAGTVRHGRLPHLTWARALLGGVFAFWLLFGFAGVYVLIQDRGRAFTPEPAYAGAAAPGVAVVPFTAAGADLDLLREGMVDLLSSTLDGLGGFRAIASRTVLARWHETVRDGVPPDLPTVLEIARRADASFAVVGGAVAVGPRVRLTASIFDLSTGADLGQAVAEGLPDDVLDLVDALSVQIVRALLAGGSAELDEKRAASILTESVPALRAFLEGEALFRRSDFPGAIRALEQAVAADSTFALALFRLAEAWGWTSGPAAQARDRYARAAERFAHRLSQRDALLLRAYVYLADEPHAAREAAREAVQRYPDDPDAWYMLGDLYYHSGGSFLAEIDEAERYLNRAVALDPGFAHYYIHLLDIAINDGREAQARELLDTFAGLAPGSDHLRRYRLALDLVFGDAGTRAAARAVLDTVPAEILAVPSLGQPLTLAAGELLARARYRRTGEPNPFTLFLSWRGKFHEMAAISGDSGFAFLFFSFHAALADAEYAFPDIESRLAFEPADPSPPRNLFAGLYAARHGRWARYDSVHAALRAEASRLAAAGDTVAAGTHEQVASLLDAYGLARHGDALAAARPLADLRRQMSGPGFLLRDRFIRLLLGELYADSSQPRDAVPYLRSMSYDRWAPALYRLGEVYERLGEPDSARAAYADFLLAWDEADEDLPLLHAAREALARLARETPTP